MHTPAPPSPPPTPTGSCFALVRAQPEHDHAPSGDLPRAGAAGRVVGDPTAPLRRRPDAAAAIGRDRGRAHGRRQGRCRETPRVIGVSLYTTCHRVKTSELKVLKCKSVGFRPKSRLARPHGFVCLFSDIWRAPSQAATPKSNCHVVRKRAGGGKADCGKAPAPQGLPHRPSSNGPCSR